MLIRRTRPPALKVGDFVSHAQQGTGVIDMIVKGSVVVYKWNGFGQKPRYPFARVFGCRAHELSIATPTTLLRRKLR